MPMITLLIVFIASGLVQVAVSVPLILGWIPPNGLYGFRVRRTMQHTGIWYPVNKYCGERLLLTSLLLVLAAVGFTHIPGIALEDYLYGVLITWVAGASLAILSCFRFINIFKIEESSVTSNLND